jgi:hypothetical protein
METECVYCAVRAEDLELFKVLRAIYLFHRLIGPLLKAEPVQLSEHTKSPGTSFMDDVMNL